MPTLERINLVDVIDKESLMHSVSVCNHKLESAIKELSELGPRIPNPEKRKSLVDRLKVVLHGLQNRA